MSLASAGVYTHVHVLNKTKSDRQPEIDLWLLYVHTQVSSGHTSLTHTLTHHHQLRQLRGVAPCPTTINNILR